MATFYTGSRPVLKGRTSAENIHTWKNKAEVYSNWSLMNTSHVLDGGPDRHVSPGTGNYPGDYFMSYIYRGGQHIAPMVGPGLGNRIDGMRYRPMEYRGLTGAAAFPSGYGHAADRAYDYALYSNYIFDGLTTAQAIPSASTGHAVRYTSTINSFGSFAPYVHKGATSTVAFPSGYGQAEPATASASDYRSKKVNVWQGVASAKAL